MGTKYFGQVSANKLMSLIKAAIPKKLSQLTNDRGFITGADVPEGAAASTTPPKMDGVQTVGTEMAFARGDHTHPSDTSKLDKAGGTMSGLLNMGTNLVMFKTPGEDVYIGGGEDKAAIRVCKLYDGEPVDVEFVGVSDPTGDSSAANKKYVDDKVAAVNPNTLTSPVKIMNAAGDRGVSLRGEYGSTDAAPVLYLRGVKDGTDENVEGVYIVGVATPMADDEAANKSYVDFMVSGKQTASDVQAAIASALTGVYTPKGTIAFSALPTAAVGNKGWVYNISNAFTTTVSFVEGAGHSYPAGTNVVCIDAGDGAYQWDVMAGTYDMSEMTEAEVQAIWDSIA